METTIDTIVNGMALTIEITDEGRVYIGYDGAFTVFENKYEALAYLSVCKSYLTLEEHIDDEKDDFSEED